MGVARGYCLWVLLVGMLVCKFVSMLVSRVGPLLGVDKL